MRKTGYMCKRDFDTDLPLGAGGHVFPTVAAARDCHYCTKQCGIVQVDIVFVRAAGSRQRFGGCILGTLCNGFMRGVDFYEDTDFGQKGAWIFGEIDRAWRRLPVNNRSLIEVEVCLIKTIVQPESARSRIRIRGRLLHSESRAAVRLNPTLIAVRLHPTFGSINDLRASIDDGKIVANTGVRRKLRSVRRQWVTSMHCNRLSKVLWH